MKCHLILTWFGLVRLRRMCGTSDCYFSTLNYPQHLSVWRTRAAPENAIPIPTPLCCLSKDYVYSLALRGRVGRKGKLRIYSECRSVLQYPDTLLSWHRSRVFRHSGLLVENLWPLSQHSQFWDEFSKHTEFWRFEIFTKKRADNYYSLLLIFKYKTLFSLCLS